MAKQFLRQFKDELTAWSNDHENASIEQLVEHFGSPVDAAEDFLSQMDSWEVNRYAYARLKRSYAALAIVVTAAVLLVGAQVSEVFSHKVATGVRYTQPILHKNGNECEMFWVKTKFRGHDNYWEYHSCSELMWLISQPESADGTEPYATELYINGREGVSHWEFNDLHCFWVKVRDDET